MNSVNQTLTSRRDPVPCPVAIVGNILAFGVVRALARAQRGRVQESQPNRADLEQGKPVGQSARSTITTSL